ncbi:MAG TPA: hypothetical protein VM759_08645 [Longimicrobium sp.]|nr:hypothetical protein [Longimicrobium sp.]
MRILILLALAALAAVPAAAQPTSDAAPSIHPLPLELAPGGAPSTAEASRMAADPMARGLLTGMLVGMTTGVGFAVTVADRCGVGSECTLAPEYKTFVYGVIGASLGALIGVGTTFLLGENATPVEASALTLVPDEDGMRAGVHLRL